MREAFSFSVSAAVHAGAYGIFLIAAPIVALYDVQMAAGKPVALVLVMPTMASQAEETPPVEIDEKPPEEVTPPEMVAQETEVERPPAETNRDDPPPLVEVSQIVAALPPAGPREKPTEEQTPTDQPPPMERYDSTDEGPFTCAMPKASACRKGLGTPTSTEGFEKRR